MAQAKAKAKKKATVVKKVAAVVKAQLCLTPAAYKKLSKGAKAIALAEDVIAQIEAHNYRPVTGEYIGEIRTKEIDEDWDVKLANDKDSLQDLILNNNLLCTVCQKGALFMSAIKFKNHYSVERAQEVCGTTGFGAEAEKFLSDAFSSKQLHIMEAVFEEDYNMWIRNVEDIVDEMDEEDNEMDDSYGYTERPKWFDETVRQANKNSRYEDEEADRIKWVMKNVIKNGGTFIIPRNCCESKAEYERLIKKFK